MRRINLILCLMVMTFGLSKAQGNLQVINISPDTTMNLVSVSIQDSVIVDSLAFNEASAYLTIPAGMNQTLTFTSIKDTSVKLDVSNITIEAGGFYQSILNGVINTDDYAENPQNISLDTMATWNEVDTSNLIAADTFIRVNFFHGISDMVALDINTLDLDNIVDSMPYKEYSNSSIDFDYKDEIILFINSFDGANLIAKRTIDLASIVGRTLTVFFSGFTVPNDNNNGPVINYYSVDEAGNVVELPFFVDTSTAIIDKSLQDFKNYPNPAENFTYLEFNTTKQSDINVSLYDLSGKQIQNQVFDVQNGFNQIKIDLPQLANGLYFLSLSIDGSLSTVPLVISQ